MSAPKGEGELFKYKMGAEWYALHADIRDRFEKNPTLEKPLHYTGVMTRMDCSRMGMAMAQLSRFSGALQPYRGSGVPVEIRVYAKPGRQDIFKQRNYFFPGWRKPFSFTSHMRLNAREEILEYVGWGLGMKLLVEATPEGNLHFISDGYFWKLGPWHLPLPAWLSPGKVSLTHRNIDRERFSICITIRHPLFGQVFWHEGDFQEKAA